MLQESVSQLSLEVTQLEERRHLLFNEEVPALTEDLARLNDTFIVEVSSQTMCWSILCSPLLQQDIASYLL